MLALEGKRPLEGTERRHAQRYVIKFPLTFRALKRSGLEDFGEVLDVSPLGIRLFTYSLLCVGETVEILLKIPEGVMGVPTPKWWWQGEIVRVASSGQGKCSGEVGIRFVAGDAVGKRAHGAKVGPKPEPVVAADSP